MSKEYIERNALLSDISETVIFSGKPGHTSAESRGANKVISRIREAPAADVVEVVRCKACEQYNTSNCYEGFGWCEELNRGVSDNHYCSYGERKDTP